MDSNEPRDDDHVVVKSAWIGNFTIIALMVIILGAALFYKNML